MIRLARNSSLFEDVASLSSMEFMRDAKIVCEDGIVKWSSLLLSQWSNLARKQVNNQSFICVDYPLTIVAPDVKVEVIEKLLRWSICGEISASPREASEISNMIVSLEGNFDFTQGPVGEDLIQPADKRTFVDGKHLIPEDHEEVSPPKKRRNIPEDQQQQHHNNSPQEAKIVKQKPAKNFKRFKNNEETKEGIPDNIDALPQISKTKPLNSCPFCNFYCDRSSHLVEHICIHYKDELMDFWGSDDYLQPCPVCGKKLGGHRSDIYKHVGISHGFLYSLPNLSPIARDLFKGRKHYYLRCGADVNATLGRYFPDCKACKLLSFDMRTLQTHLAQIHFTDDLLLQFDRSSCKNCSAKVNGNYAAIQHLLENHSQLFESLLPTELAQMMSKKSKILTACPICSLSFKSKNLLRVHLTRTHFKQDILDLCQVTDPTKCVLCGFSSMRSNNQSGTMTQHLGLSHNKLDEVLPPEIRDKLNEKEEEKEPVQDFNYNVKAIKVECEQ